MNINWMTPVQRQALQPKCPPGQSRNTAFRWVAAVTIVLLAQGVPGDSLPVVLLALTVLTVVVSGTPASGSSTASRAASYIAGLWPRVQVTS
jgi:hypothetical protein